MLNSYSSCSNEIFKIRNYCHSFEVICYFCFSVVVSVDDVAVSVSVVVIFVIVISVDVSVVVSVDVDVGHCRCRNSAVNIFYKVITVDIVASISGTAVDVTKYVIILISVIIGVGGGGGGSGGWNI